MWGQMERHSGGSVVVAVMACVVVIASNWGVEAGRLLPELLSDWDSSHSNANAQSCRDAPALFVFGASYMDVGENFAAMPFRTEADFPPYGMDFFGAPTGRHSNGRLIIDHISQGLGQELLSPYLWNVGASFQHGVSFASSGSTASNSSILGDGSDSSGLFSLSVQVDQFRIFHQQSLSMYKAKKGLLPAPDAFSRGVYIIESGNNDYHGLSSDQFEAMIALVLQNLEQALKALYNEGARTIVIMDVFPVACFPCMLWNTAPHQLNRDGCVIATMKNIEQHNIGLQNMVATLKAELMGATLTIFSLHDVFMSAIRNPSKFGLKYVHTACCGYGGGDYNFNKAVVCGKDGIVNGELMKATVCENPSEYMIWDALHPTDAFAFHIAQAFLKGKYMQPPLYIKEMCLRKQ